MSNRWYHVPYILLESIFCLTIQHYDRCYSMEHLMRSVQQQYTIFKHNLCTRIMHLSIICLRVTINQFLSSSISILRSTIIYFANGYKKMKMFFASVIAITNAIDRRSQVIHGRNAKMKLSITANRSYRLWSLLR